MPGLRRSHRLTGAGIMLMSDDVARGPVCTSDEVSALVEQLRYDLGEGPCLDAGTVFSEKRHARGPGFTDETVAVHPAIVSLMEEPVTMDWYGRRADDGDDEQLRRCSCTT